MKKPIYILLLLYSIIAVLTIIFFNGTGDAGDSVMHYLFAKYAPVHPQLYFDHWAKPVYVLLASPFAQFGFTGIKIFNVLISLVTIYFTYKIALLLEVKNPVVVSIILIFSPLYYILTFSGLTEPLFALFIALSIYLALQHWYLAAGIVISFLPFVRSEGLIILGVFGIFFIYKHLWKLIPFLLFGTVVYSVAGYFVYHDFLWVFTKIPYAKLSSTYGSGPLYHYARYLIFVVGVPIYFLFVIGFISWMVQIIKSRIIKDEQILILLGFICFFTAHSLFWYLGIFNSMGLIRVFVGVIPLISIISLYGFNFLTETLLPDKRNLKLSIQGLFIAYIIVFPFTSNPNAINWKKDMMLNKDQLTAQQTADYIKTQIGTHHCFIYAHPYLTEALNIDYFDKGKRLNLTKEMVDQVKPGDIIIWENWFALVESQIKKEDLDQNPKLVKLYESTVEDKGSEIIYSVYEKR